MVAGMIPMAAGLGEGGDQASPLGRAVIGGLIASTFAALFILPLVFAWAMNEIKPLQNPYHLIRKIKKANTIYPHYMKISMRSLTGKIFVAGGLLLISLLPACSSKEEKKEAAKEEKPAAAPATEVFILAKGKTFPLPYRCLVS